MSLRARLTLGLIVLATIGVVTVDIVNYTSLRTFLLDRADQSLDNANLSVTSALQEGITLAAGDPKAIKSLLSGAIPSLAGAIPGNCVQIRTPANTTLGSHCLAQFQQAPLPQDPVYPVGSPSRTRAIPTATGCAT